jgi:hypothetical protein
MLGDQMVQVGDRWWLRNKKTGQAWPRTVLKIMASDSVADAYDVEYEDPEGRKAVASVRTLGSVSEDQLQKWRQEHGED